jgi:chromosome segregation and condensation protein ScpB
VAPGAADRSLGGVRLRITTGTLWRLATRGISPDVARQQVSVDRDEELARAALQILSIIR